MKNKLKTEDIAILKDIAANQLSPLSKMELYIKTNYGDTKNEENIKFIAKDILDEVAAELGFQTKYSNICK